MVPPSITLSPVLGIFWVAAAALFVSGQQQSECAASTNADDTCPSSPTSSDQCGIYIAPSSIPGAGWGVYSVQAHPEGSVIGHPDTCHTMVNKLRSIIENYEWDGPSLGVELEGHVVTGLAPGFGMLVNGHYELDNVALDMPYWNDARLHRSTSPAAGSFSLLHNVTSLSTKPIPAGSELFLNYGREYFSDRPQYRGKVFSKSEFAFADKINENLASFADKHEAELSEEAKGKTMDLIRGILSDIPDLSKSTKLVPETFQEVKQVAKVGTARNQFPDSIRSLEWLQANGWCADNLRPAISSKPERGRGAFATRPIRKGEVVVASPLMHLFESQLNFTIKDYNGKGSSATRKQQVLNYCFGNPQSSLVLFPYAPLTNLINHDSTDANVELRWAADDKQPEWWREGRRDEILTKDKRKYGGAGMILEYVASRNIEEGEEVTINYGSRWIDAWNKHVAEWSPPPGSEAYVEASTLNKAESDNAVRTVEEQVKDPYPPNIRTACYAEWWRDYNEFEDIGEDDAQDSTLELEVEWKDNSYLFNGHHSLRPCNIVERKHGGQDGDEDLYSVQLLNMPQQHPEETIEDFEKVIAKNVPRRAITFVNKLYTTDQHLESAFRHSIGIDDLWPSEWKDLSGKSQ